MQINKNEINGSFDFVDSHAHYYDEAFDSDRYDLLQRINGAGVKAILNCGEDYISSYKCIALAKRFGFCYAAAGVHPHEAAKCGVGWLEEIASLMSHPKVIAIGEIGLDYHYDFSPRAKQIEVFEKQLRLSKELDMPVIIHDREAHGDTMNLLRKYRPKGVVHCFSGSVETMRETAALGMYVGLGGAVTFKNAKIPVEVARELPLDRLLLETDAPYMSPVPYRGKRCDSLMIAETAKKISEIKSVPIEEIYRTTTENFERLFAVKVKPD
ncbi:MAG: TatD family hydrolase [Clostridia bacterium]|nr:TatD family hydrolase [Clostridia bacterium]